MGLPYKALTLYLGLILLPISLLGVLVAFRMRRAEQEMEAAFAAAKVRYDAGEFVRRHDPYLPDGQTWGRGDVPKAPDPPV